MRVRQTLIRPKRTLRKRNSKVKSIIVLIMYLIFNRVIERRTLDEYRT
jgi:hypothetical protein